MKKTNVLGATGFIVFALAALCAAPAEPAQVPAGKGATMTYRRVFKGSSPEFIEIKVREESDEATFEVRQLDEDPGASPFAVGAPLRAKMFALAGELRHFAGLDLDVKRKLADLGTKTFRWERGAEAHETTFNYTLDSSANQLMQVFEGLALQQEHAMTLARRMKYDPLGLNDALLDFAADLNGNRLAEPQRIVPLLDQIANDSRIMSIARQRARALAERIRQTG
jgi:hypothetical protein